MSENENTNYLTAIIREIGEMRKENKEQFAQVNKQFEQINVRLDRQDVDMRSLTSRFDRLEATILQTRAETVEHRADIRDLEARVAVLEGKF